MYTITSFGRVRDQLSKLNLTKETKVERLRTCAFQKLGKHVNLLRVFTCNWYHRGGEPERVAY